MTTTTTTNSSLFSLDSDKTSQEDNKAESVQDNHNDNNDNHDIKTCTQQLDNLLLHYTVTEAAELRRETSEGSGAEDTVCVTSIELLL
jgi:hypothetical protein